MKWGINLLITVFCTMVAIYLIRTVTEKYNIPIIKDVVAKN